MTFTKMSNTKVFVLAAVGAILCAGLLLKRQRNIWKSKCDKELKKAALPFLQKNLAGWQNVSLNDFDFEPLSGGATNRNYICRRRVATGGDHETVVLRIFGEGTEAFFRREDEHNVFTSIGELGMGPKMLGKHDDARLEEYIPSQTVLSEHVRTPQMIENVARQLRDFHKIDVSYGEHTPHSEQVHLFERIAEWYNAAVAEIEKSPDLKARVEAKIPHISYYLGMLKHDVRMIEKLVPKSPRVFCHNDLQLANLLNKGCTEKPDVVFIDYEYGGYNPLAFDIANHFCEWMYDLRGEALVPQRHLYPSEEQRKQFIRVYLGEEASEETVEELSRTVQIYSYLSDLKWSLWAIVSAASSTIDFDYIEYASHRLVRYFEHRDLIIPTPGCATCQMPKAT
eukprot:Rmarinus@m.2490